VTRNVSRCVLSLAKIGLLVCVFGAGVLVTKQGIFGKIQRLINSEPPLISIERPSGLNDDNTYCVVVAGQSNAASHGLPRGRAGNGCFALTVSGWFAGEDPWPGSSGNGGSVWSRLAPQIRNSGMADHVVVGCVAAGSCRIDDWVSGGKLKGKLDELAQAYRNENLTVDAVIWHQGETESWQWTADPIDYRQQLSSLVDRCQIQFPEAVIVICQTSRDVEGVVHPGIRLAQQVVCDGRDRVIAGPDTDALDETYRHDGVHWNEKGMECFATLLLERI